MMCYSPICSSLTPRSPDTEQHQGPHLGLSGRLRPLQDRPPRLSGCAQTAPRSASGICSARSGPFPTRRKAVNQRINSSGGLFQERRGGAWRQNGHVRQGEAGSDCRSGAVGASRAGADGSGVGAAEGTPVSRLFSPSAPAIGPEARGLGRQDRSVGLKGSTWSWARGGPGETREGGWREGRLEALAGGSGGGNPLPASPLQGDGPR